jgi:hypothetical protein
VPGISHRSHGNHEQALGVGQKLANPLPAPVQQAGFNQSGVGLRNMDIDVVHNAPS